MHRGLGSGRAVQRATSTRRPPERAAPRKQPEWGSPGPRGIAIATKPQLNLIGTRRSPASELASDSHQMPLPADPHRWATAATAPGCASAVPAEPTRRTASIQAAGIVQCAWRIQASSVEQPRSEGLVRGSPATPFRIRSTGSHRASLCPAVPSALRTPSCACAPRLACATRRPRPPEEKTRRNKRKKRPRAIKEV